MNKSITPLNNRLHSLDVLRGITVLGMIIVNIAANLFYSTDVPISKALLHASWEGFKLPDLVFPAFIFIVGMSIAYSLSKAKQSEHKTKTYRRIAVRSLKLIILGFILSNIFPWFYELDASKIRYFGVLQRIGFVYFFAAILYLVCSWRVLAILTASILVLYCPLTLLPFPDGSPDLHLAGSNFVSWFDRAVFGDHNYVKGAMGYDPEGVISTLPTIAQCLLGSLFGIWLKSRQHDPKTLVHIISFGIVATALGLGLGLFFPIVKDLWSTSFVLLSSGLTLLVFGLSFAVCELGKYKGRISTFFETYGVNAIAAYTLHFLLSFIVTSAPMIASYTLADHFLPSALAGLVPVVIFCWIIWYAMRWLQKKGIFIKI